MSVSHLSRTVQVTNPAGLHLRAATELAKLVRRFLSRVTIIKGQRRVDGRDTLQILTLVVGQGDQLLFEAVGEDAEAALDAVADLFSRSFGEEETD